MKLLKFKIRNYKRIEETGWVDVNDVTAFVGGNESGKTSILQALWKLKPGRANIVLDPQDEFPRRRLTDDYARGDQRWPVVSALFEISPEVYAELIEIDSAFEQCEQVVCTNFYDDARIEVEFIPEVELWELSEDYLFQLIEDIKVTLTTAEYDLSLVEPVISKTEEGEEPEVLKPPEQVVEEYKAQIINIANEEQASIDGNLTAQLQTFRDRINDIVQHSWQREVWKGEIESINKILQQPSIQERLRQAQAIVWKNVPIFIYFDDYNLLESQIYIPEAIQSIAAHSTDPAVRSQWALFELAGFDIKEISELAFQQSDPNQTLTDEAREVIFREANKRSIYASSAGRAITEKFIEWWHQHRHTIDFHVDGQVFRIQVEDKNYPVPIQFEQRSKGFRWFFTFYLVFTAETDRQHQNAIILLDEPGLHLYKPAQEQLLAFFDELSAHNQVMYTTHSPFMIDSSHLERVRLVEEMDNGLVRISPDTQSIDDRVVFPVETAFLNQFAHLLFLSRRVLVVEGETDHRLLKHLSDELIDAGRIGLPERTVIIAAKGNRSVHPLVALMVPHGFEILALLDSDESGRSAGEKLEELDFPEEQLIMVDYYGDIVGEEDPFDLESFLPEDLYRKAVEETHELNISGRVKSTKKDSFSVAIKKYLKNQDVDFDKGLPIEWILQQWREGTPIPTATLDYAELVFEKLHEALDQ